MIDEVWLVRHGVTASNAGRIIQGHTDTPLAPEGEAQARRLGAHLAGLGVAFDAFESSDLLRARRTAELVAEPLDLGQPRTDPRWREASYGELEGRPGAELGPLRALPEAESAATAPTGGESLLTMQARVVAAFDERTTVGAGRLLLVTHGGPIAALVCHVLRVPYGPRAAYRFRRDNTGVTIVRRSRSEPDAWRLATLNAVDHLRAPDAASSVHQDRRGDA